MSNSQRRNNQITRYITALINAGLYSKALQEIGVLVRHRMQTGKEAIEVNQLNRLAQKAVNGLIEAI